ncbi:trefoil factor 3-like [Mesocricetus auratus]|uniref:Trefoil factor 3 n=1 Tax=Mesocricetus auratus TaxID=10036 RepID=A0ABM2WB89_MESAU|nr:trefoil factor 3-like [Mesocricetus auratus]
METRTLWLMLLVLLAGSSGIGAEYVGLALSECKVPPEHRKDCGFPGISEEECNHRGCCFDSSILRAPWCFFLLHQTE